jgi:dimethylhistidine N-methyltransferase
MPIKSNDSDALMKQRLCEEIEIGLLAQYPFISPKFLYDTLGSHLFTAITLLPEYYPSATEKRIFAEFGDEIAQKIGPGGTLIDLGAGNCEKAKVFLPIIQPSHYVAIDFSVEFLNDALSKLQAEHPTIRMQSMGMDFSKGLSIPDSVPMNRTFFYPGSSLGNFYRDEARQLLSEIQTHPGDGGLLIGIDLMKSDDILLQAYDDPLKITAAFNLNILRSVNSIIGSDFDVTKFCHKVLINRIENRVELYLEALENVEFSWPGNHRTFLKGERIHTENSHKYTIDSIHELLKQSGFDTTTIWTDPKNYFAVIYAK